MTLAAHAEHPELGANAILQLAKLVPEIEALTELERGLSANVGIFRGGEACNFVPHLAEAELEIRARDNRTIDETLEKIHTLGTLHSAQRDDKSGLEPEFVRIDTFVEKALLNALAICSLG